MACELNLQIFQIVNSLLAKRTYDYKLFHQFLNLFWRILKRYDLSFVIDFLVLLIQSQLSISIGHASIKCGRLKGALRKGILFEAYWC